MYTVDLLATLERALGWEPAIEKSIAERENAILAEIKRLKGEKPKRIPAARPGWVKVVERDVAEEILKGRTVKSVAVDYGVSPTQARAAAERQVGLAVSKRLNKIKQQGSASRSEWEIPVLEFVGSSTAKGGMLKRAQSNIAIVEMALKEMWKDQDKENPDWMK
jgi:hypothetical protein